MKKIFLVLTIFSFSLLSAQNDDFFDFGIVAGLNFGSNGDYSSDFTSDNLKSDNKLGYHGGIYLNFNFSKFYLRPEGIYTKTKSDYNSSDFDVEKIDLPILFGIKLFKPLSIFAGPSFQYTLSAELEDIDTDEIDIENEFVVNGQFGLAVQLGQQIRLDARYEIGLSDNISTIRNNNLDTNIGTIDSKPNQLIFSLSLQL